VEVAEVRRDVFFMIRGLGVLSESFCQWLGNCSGRADVFRLGKESGCPDLVAFFERFIWEVGLGVGLASSSSSASSTKAGKGLVRQVFIRSVSSLFAFRSALWSA